jgi:hypothetical protein
VHVYAQVTIDGFQAEDDGVDIIAAFEPVSGICVGTGEFTSGGNIYGLNIYGDDSTTPEDDGMNPGENFLLVVYDASANRTITYTQEFDQWSNQNGAVIPAYSDWQAVYEFNCSADNCWDGGVPPVDWPTYVYPMYSVLLPHHYRCISSQVTVDGFQAEDDGVDIIAAFEPVSGICVGTGEFTSGGNIYGLKHLR